MTYTIEGVQKNTHADGHNGSVIIDERLTNDLNHEISIDEIKNSIKKLQNDKSVLDDLVSNEMLKSSGSQLLHLLQKLFNHCLQEGIYTRGTAPSRHRCIKRAIARILTTIVQSPLAAVWGSYSPVSF